LEEVPDPDLELLELLLLLDPEELLLPLVPALLLPELLEAVLLLLELLLLFVLLLFEAEELLFF
jgi:hypothetical protein